MELNSPIRNVFFDTSNSIPPSNAQKVFFPLDAIPSEIFDLILSYLPLSPRPLSEILKVCSLSHSFKAAVVESRELQSRIALYKIKKLLFCTLNNRENTVEEISWYSIKRNEILTHIKKDFVFTLKLANYKNFYRLLTSLARFHREEHPNLKHPKVIKRLSYNAIQELNSGKLDDFTDRIIDFLIEFSALPSQDQLNQMIDKQLKQEQPDWDRIKLFKRLGAAPNQELLQQLLAKEVKLFLNNEEDKEDDIEYLIALGATISPTQSKELSLHDSQCFKLTRESAYYLSRIYNSERKELLRQIDEVRSKALTSNLTYKP